MRKIHVQSRTKSSEKLASSVDYFFLCPVDVDLVFVVATAFAVVVVVFTFLDMKLCGR